MQWIVIALVFVQNVWVDFIFKRTRLVVGLGFSDATIRFTQQKRCVNQIKDIKVTLFQIQFFCWNCELVMFATGNGRISRPCSLDQSGIYVEYVFSPLSERSLFRMAILWDMVAAKYKSLRSNCLCMAHFITCINKSLCCLVCSTNNMNWSLTVQRKRNICSGIILRGFCFNLNFDFSYAFVTLTYK